MNFMTGTNLIQIGLDEMREYPELSESKIGICCTSNTKKLTRMLICLCLQL